MIKRLEIETRLNYIEDVISSPNFLTTKGFGSNVPYYIFDYDAKDELKVRKFLESINFKNSNYNVEIIDLYEIMCEVLEEKKFLSRCKDMEEQLGTTSLCQGLRDVMRLSERSGPLYAHIKSRLSEKTILFLTGIGKAYPVIRAHLLLENLPVILAGIPIVLFYPGKYVQHEQQELLLFGTINDESYYQGIPFPDPKVGN